MNESKSYQVIGYGLAILQAVLYSMLGIFGKLIYATGLNAQQAVILRFLAATVILGAFMLIRRKEAMVSRQPSVYLQAIFFYVSSLFYFFAVENLTAGMTTVIFYTYPAVVAVASIFVFKERFSISVALALVLAIGGLLLVSGITADEMILDPLGIFFGIVSCLSFAIYTILIQKTGRSESPLTVTLTLEQGIGSGLIIASIAVVTVAPMLKKPEESETPE